MRQVMRVLLAVALATGAAAAVHAASAPDALPAAFNEPAHVPESVPLKQAVITLPIAGALGAVLAFRPQRRGTPPRTPPVIQTQIILSLVGALVMLVVGASLARAFGIVGAASLVRYRAKVDDPKDAGVMLCCLAIGLASGVGIYLFATFATAFIWSALWVLESIEPQTRNNFLLKIKVKEAMGLRDPIEAVLRGNKVRYELRASSAEDMTYSVQMPLSKKTDVVTNGLLGLGNGEMAVEWSDKKAKDKA
jgi:uncharacterized membrane protein YhiD involved in acid resistance